jgi:hypothetical protein
VEKSKSTKMVPAANGVALDDDGIPVDKHVDVERSGKVIIIPEGMKYGEARVWLSRKEKSEEEMVKVIEEVHAYPLDGALALAKALARTYGWVSQEPTPGFFGPKPPYMVSLPIGPNEGDTVQVPWGAFSIPNVEGQLMTLAAKSGGQPILVIAADVKKKHADAVKQLATLTREIVKTESVYRGKAVIVSFPEDEDEDVNFNEPPKFFDVSKVVESDLVLPADIDALVRVNLFAPIENTEACRKHRVPLKRGVLMEGPYGVGKTLTANVTAKKANENGWTFIYLKDVRQLDKAVRFGSQYQPAVIFAEDIDRAVSGGRTSEMDTILNTVDGVDSKSSEVMIVLTTNHIENINKAMVRPGRLDAVIPMRAPDVDAVHRLVRLYARGLLDEKEDVMDACRALDGQIPAVVREVVERSKLGAIGRGAKTLRINGGDLLTAAKSMLAHLALMRPEPEDFRSDEEKAAAVLGDSIVKAAAVRAASPTNGHTKEARA